MTKNHPNRQFKYIFWIKWVLPAFLITLFEWIKNYPGWIEKNYSNGWYISIGRALRFSTGWVPFSLGDVLYVILGVGIVIELIRLAIALFQHISRSILFGFLLRWCRSLMWIYIVFNCFWGLNYYRSGITAQLQLEPYRYCKEEVVLLTDSLIQKVNEYRRQIPDTGLPQKPLYQIKQEAKNSYSHAAQQFSFLAYHPVALKNSLYSKLGMYLGITGYYNPFSGEAQYRNDIPAVLLPYVMCHEIGHQIGYASESEANFAGYLSCSSSTDPYFLYSVYLDLFTYAQSEEIRIFMHDGDTTGLKSALLYNKTHIDSLVKKDRKAIRSFFMQEENKVSPVMSNI